MTVAELREKIYNRKLDSIDYWINRAKKHMVSYEVNMERASKPNIDWLDFDFQKVFLESAEYDLRSIHRAVKNAAHEANIILGKE